MGSFCSGMKNLNLIDSGSNIFTVVKVGTDLYVLSFFSSVCHFSAMITFDPAVIGDGKEVKLLLTNQDEVCVA